MTKLILKPIAKKVNTLAANKAKLKDISVINHVDNKNLSIANEVLLTLSAKDFATVIANDLDRCNLAGYSTYGFISSLGWGLKFALSSLTRTLTNDFSLFVCTLVDKRNKENGTDIGVKALDAKDAKAIAERATKIANTVEDLYTEYEFHAEAISNMSPMGFELHPFMRRIEASYQLNNDLDGDEQWEDEAEDFTIDGVEEQYRAERYLREIEEIMAPSQGAQWRKANVTAARDAEPKAVYEAVTKEEFIHDLVGRSMDEHRKIASFATWKAIGSLIERLHQRYGQPVENKGQVKRIASRDMLLQMFPDGVPTKKLSLILKLRNKRWAVKTQIQYLTDRINWLSQRIDQLDADAAQETIASVQNADNIDRLNEAEIDLANALAQEKMLDTWMPEFDRLLALADLRDQETGEKFTPPMFSFYSNFDVIEFVARQVKAKKRLEGLNLTEKMARTEAERMLGNPQASTFTTVRPTVDSVTGEIKDKPVKIHSLSFFEDTDYTELAKRLGDIRRKHAQTDKAQQVLRMLAATHKQMGMKNKKVTTAMVDDLMSSFDDARFAHLDTFESEKIQMDAAGVRL
ncbi:hypothetical protein [Shewanella gaetbuli]|uniref:Uncharacterized protein n=1 Tax=Shewanella gaetbuli TaxID=220752 RepID=A0A9X2CLR0_9GAMM|nr:hypothetical protein [Shewanella gaetbuli]MCL1142969.1 hypothetical protein [Shewanella gaetbuli]